jgi:hypothetical protein
MDVSALLVIHPIHCTQPFVSYIDRSGTFCLLLFLCILLFRQVCATYDIVVYMLLKRHNEKRNKDTDNFLVTVYMNLANNHRGNWNEVQ